MTDLQKKSEDAIEKNHQLRELVAELREEIFTLKNLLLAHKDCMTSSLLYHNYKTNP